MTDAIVPLTRRPAWGVLEAHYQKLRDMHLRTLFAEDPGRGERLAVEAVGEEMAGEPVELLASHHADADEMDAYERLSAKP